MTPEVKDRHLGFCTQFAVFKINNDIKSNLVGDFIFQDHLIISNFEFPWFDKEVTDEEIVNCVLEYTRYISPIRTTIPEGWPVFRIENFRDPIKVRQHTRSLIGFKEFLSSPSRNFRKFYLLDDDHFVLCQKLAKKDSGSWPSKLRS